MKKLLSTPAAGKDGLAATRWDKYSSSLQELGPGVLSTGSASTYSPCHLLAHQSSAFCVPQTHTGDSWYLTLVSWLQNSNFLTQIITSAWDQDFAVNQHHKSPWLCYETRAEKQSLQASQGCSRYQGGDTPFPFSSGSPKDPFLSTCFYQAVNSQSRALTCCAPQSSRETLLIMGLSAPQTELSLYTYMHTYICAPSLLLLPCQTILLH